MHAPLPVFRGRWASQAGVVTGLLPLSAEGRVLALWGQVQADTDVEAKVSVDSFSRY